MRVEKTELHPNAIDMAGMKIGKVTVLEPTGESYFRGPVWLCRCSCGAEVAFSSQYLRAARRRSIAISCGCARFKSGASVVLCRVCGGSYKPKWRQRDGRYKTACSRACAMKIRDISGAKNPNWRNDSTLRNLGDRFTHKYRVWRMAVLRRDNFRCVQCGDAKKKPLHVDHIKPFSVYKELRFDIDNGRALCRPCHMKTETWGHRATSIES